MDREIRIAVISDIHCHKKREHPSSQSSFFTTNSPKNPIKQHPVASILSLIKERELEADLLVLPGDFCDQMDEDGFNLAWSEIRQIASKLNVKDVLSTLGNHDVNSRSSGADDVFRFARNMDTDFPFKEISDSEKFWVNGFVLKEYRDLDLAILALNSSFHHYSLPESRRGSVDLSQLEKIEKQLGNLGNFKFKLCFSHHHPVPHEAHLGGSEDVMVNGSLVIDVLERYGFHFYIHGHKHDPRLIHAGTTSRLPYIFAAGSFSRHPYPSLSGVLNCFHILKFLPNSVNNCDRAGLIETYFFTLGNGFEQIDTKTFPHIAGFGYRHAVIDIIQSLRCYLKELYDKQGDVVYCKWSEVIEKIPEVDYLIPSALNELELQCSEIGITFLKSKNKLESVMYQP